MSTPQVVLDALCPAPSGVAGKPFRPVTAAHILALEASGSAFIDERREITYADTLRACAVLTRSGAEARQLAADTAALSAEVDALAESVPPSELRGLVGEVVRLVAASMSTGLRVATEGGAPGEPPASA